MYQQSCNTKEPDTDCRVCTAISGWAALSSEPQLPYVQHWPLVLSLSLAFQQRSSLLDLTIVSCLACVTLGNIYIDSLGNHCNKVHRCSNNTGFQQSTFMSRLMPIVNTGSFYHGGNVFLTLTLTTIQTQRFNLSFLLFILLNSTRH